MKRPKDFRLGELEKIERAIKYTRFLEEKV